MDYQLEQWMNGPAGSHPAWDAAMRAVALSGEAIFVGLAVVWFLYGWLRGRAAERQGSISALLGAGGALLVNQVITHVWFRPRPFITHPATVHVLLGHSTDASFPSDHAAAAFAVGVVVMAFHRRVGLVALGFGLLMSYARVYVGDHYPGDIAAAAAIGIVAAAVLLTWLYPVTFALRLVGDRLITAFRLPLPNHDVPAWQASHSQGRATSQ